MQAGNASASQVQHTAARQCNAHLGIPIKAAQNGDGCARQQLVVDVCEYEPGVGDGHGRRALALQQHCCKAAVRSAGGPAQDQDRWIIHGCGAERCVRTSHKAGAKSPNHARIMLTTATVGRDELPAASVTRNVTARGLESGFADASWYVTCDNASARAAVGSFPPTLRKYK